MPTKKYILKCTVENLFNGKPTKNSYYVREICLTPSGVLAYKTSTSHVDATWYDQKAIDVVLSLDSELTAYKLTMEEVEPWK